MNAKRRQPVVPQRPAATKGETPALPRDCTERSGILRAMREELVAELPDRRIALGGNREFVVAETHEEVLAKLKDRGGCSPRSVMERLELNPTKRTPTAWRRTR